MNMTGRASSHSRSRPPSNFRVLAVLGANTGCEWVRIIMPFEYLRAHGHDVVWMWSHQVKDHIHMFSDYNIFPLIRRIPREDRDNILHLIEAEQQRGSAVIYETDDDPFSERFSDNPDGVKEIIDACDAVTVSTKPLLRRVNHPNAHVFENSLSAHLWDMYPKIPSQEIRIGISGTRTHYEDWMIVKEALFRVARKHSNVRFFTFGYTPDYFEGLPRLTELPPVPYTEYPKHLKNFDIGLAPLIRDSEGFNQYKSPIKALDYALAGAAPVVSDHSVYRQVDCARRVKDSDWFDALDRLISSPGELAKLKARSEKWVRKHRTLEVTWPNLARAYNSIWRNTCLPALTRTSA